MQTNQCPAKTEIFRLESRRAGELNRSYILNIKKIKVDSAKKNLGEKLLLDGVKFNKNDWRQAPVSALPPSPRHPLYVQICQFYLQLVTKREKMPTSLLRLYKSVP